MKVAKAEIERRRQLRARRGGLGIALIIPLFAVVEGISLGRFPTESLAIRLVWAACMVALVLPFPTGQRRYLYSVRGMVAVSTLAIAAIAHVSGGSGSVVFAALPALPAVVVALLHEDASNALVAGATAVLGGAVILALEGATLAHAAGWLVFISGMTVVGWFGGRLLQKWLAELVEIEDSRLHTVAQLALSERRRGESERLALVGQLAAGVAHEVNNPLAFVKSNLNFLEAELSKHPDAELQHALRDATDGVRRIEQIVRDLRSFSRSESEEQPGEVSLAAVVDEAARIASVRLKTVGALELQVDAGLPPVWAVHGRLLQVLVNLLVNAADALEERQSPGVECRVRVSASAEGEAVRLVIEDNGPGIPSGLEERIFEPFFTTKPAGKGTGLGLPLSREYVERQGGTLRAESRAEGGARFVIQLPRASERLGPRGADGSQ